MGNRPKSWRRRAQQTMKNGDWGSKTKVRDKLNEELNIQEIMDMSERYERMKQEDGVETRGSSDVQETGV